MRPPSIKPHLGSNLRIKSLRVKSLRIELLRVKSLRVNHYGSNYLRLSNHNQKKTLEATVLTCKCIYVKEFQIHLLSVLCNKVLLKSTCTSRPILFFSVRAFVEVYIVLFVNCMFCYH